MLRLSLKLNIEVRRFNLHKRLGRGGLPSRRTG
jgi:hypothetical protein